MDNTPYDDVFRTLLTDCTELMIPVVNEIFHTKYTGKETICLLQNEHFIKMPDGSEQERITDSSFEIISSEETSIPQVLKNQLYGGSAGYNTAQRKRYHIECQSTEDGSMIVRMFEYDIQLALDMSRKVIEHIAVKYKNVAKGVSRTMGGKVLNYEAKDILNRGRAEGRREGEEQTKIQIAKKLLALGNDIQSVADLAELPEETVEKLARSMNQTKR